MYILTLILLFIFSTFCIGDDTQADQTDGVAGKKADPAWLRYCNEKSAGYQIYPFGKPRGDPIWESPDRWGRVHTGGKTVSGLVLPE